MNETVLPETVLPSIDERNRTTVLPSIDERISFYVPGMPFDEPGCDKMAMLNHRTADNS